jgi:hypothetical protein
LFSPKFRALVTEAVCTSETSVCSKETTRRYKPEGSDLVRYSLFAKSFSEATLCLLIPLFFALFRKKIGFNAKILLPNNLSYYFHIKLD